MGRFRRWWPLLAVVALTTAAGMAASTAQLPLSRLNPVEAEAESAPTAEPPREDVAEPSAAADVRGGGFDLPAWVMWVVLGLLGAVIAVVIVRFALQAAAESKSRFRRRRIPRRELKPETSPAAEVRAAVEAGLLELDESDRDPRRAVIACWVRLERAAEAAGTARAKGDTSTDLVLRLLAGHHLSATVLTSFADVYRLARYSSNNVDESMRTTARTALARLRDELAGAAV